MHASRIILSLILISPLFIGADDFTGSKTRKMDTALSTLEAGEYGETLDWWASDERGGREPGTEGSIAAGDWAAAEFGRLGLNPVGDEIDGEPSFFQYLDRGGKRGLFPGYDLSVDGQHFETDSEWSLLGGCDVVDLKQTEVVFAGYGITAPEYEYDDYKGLDVKGKAVLIFRYEPQEKDEDSAWNGKRNTQFSFFRAKLEEAEKRGAKALFFVNGPLHHDPEKDPLSRLSTVVSRNSKIPMVHVRKAFADRLVEPTGMTLEALQKRIDETGKPYSRELHGIRLDFKAEVGDLARARNVLGLLEGSDPRLKEEVVVVGAHYDHLGLGAYGSRTPDRLGEIHNGADDNASGSVGVVEMAEALVEAGYRPRRSILFMLFDAEEKGLLGSRHYVENTVVPIEKTVAMINLDMIARAKEGNCSIMGTGSAEEWEEILKAAEEGSTMTFNHSGGGFGGSDQASFLRKEIPVLFFFTGIHSEYHTPDDDSELCDDSTAVEILKVAFKTLVAVADRDKGLTFKKQDRTRRPRARMGIFTEAPEEGEGLRINRLMEGGAAEKAGLQVGDMLLRIDDTVIEGRQALISVLRKAKPGDAIKVTYRRGDEEYGIEVVLGGG